MSKVAKLKIIYQNEIKDSDIKRIITAIYSENKNYISGMNYTEYKSEEDYKKYEQEVQELKEQVKRIKSMARLEKDMNDEKNIEIEKLQKENDFLKEERQKVATILMNKDKELKDLKKSLQFYITKSEEQMR